MASTIPKSPTIGSEKTIDPMSAPELVGLDVVGLTVSFANHRVLDRFSVNVAPGEIVALMGESGSGKSTLLRAIAGLAPIDEGTIRIDGDDVTYVPTHKRDLGFVFQDLALFTHLNVAENIAYGLRRRGIGRIERSERVSELLELVGLPDAHQRSVSTLSGGEQQRVAVARALAPRPRILLLDEPLTALDADRKSSLALELRRIMSVAGTTALHVTHDRHEAEVVADRIVHLVRQVDGAGWTRNGLLLAIGQPR